jgi:hypothetical protein
VTGVHLTHNQNGGLTMGIDVNSEPRLTYSLESLPALLTKRDCRLILEALNAGEFFSPVDWAGEKMGEVIATLIHRRAEDQRKAASKHSELLEGLF